MSAIHPLPGKVAPAPAAAAASAAAASIGFTTPDLLGWLEAATGDDLDVLPFGVVAMLSDGTVERYNAFEGELSGLTPHRVVGRNFFTAVAPCTNNFMVAHRFATEPDIDAVIDYVFTFRLAPTKVRLRMLKRPHARHMYLAVERRAVERRAVERRAVERRD